ncbi:hypothetical protein [Pseudomonas huaxiensis]|uniref:hypothetical protein n=1 Tax=Pseudomonas huaxiensis TaxID=2213017 RepID=UPI000DA69772|nr:hypothetical protein [Pseudomonas huaxiensis]
MKRFLAALLLIPALAMGAGNDLLINQRNPADTATLTRAVVPPSGGGVNGVMGYNGATNLPAFFRFGAGLALDSGAVVALPQVWADITGKPNFAAVATSGAYADLSGKPALFSGAYADLTGVPSTFNPAAHTHAAGEIVSGTLATARLPVLAISQTTGLQTALDSKFPAPTGSAAQYIRGDGSTAAFPALFSGTYADLSGIPATFAPAAHTQAWSTITATPTTLAGYGVLDGVTQSALTTTLGGYATTAALTSGLAGKFNIPTGNAAQYLRGDGSVATFPTIPGGTVTSVTAGTGLAGGTITTTGTISLPNTGTAGSYANVTTDAQGRVTAGTNRSFANPARSLNAAFQINSIRDAWVVYTVDISVTSLLLAGTSGRVYLEYADDSGMATNLVAVNSSPNATGGVLNVTNLGSGNVTGFIPAGKYARIRTANVSGTATFTLVGSQEVLQ